MNEASHHPSQDTMLQWISGELQGPEAQVLEAHVAACPGCAAQLADECALDVVMHAAVDLAAEDDVVVLAPPAAARAVGRGPWRQVFAAAAGFALLMFAGKGALDSAAFDQVDPELGGDTVVIADGPASWDRVAEEIAEPICEPSLESDEGEEVCAEPLGQLVAMAAPLESTPWSVMADASDAGDDDPCTTPVDTGESLTCDDWLSSDDFAG